MNNKQYIEQLKKEFDKEYTDIVTSKLPYGAMHEEVKKYFISKLLEREATLFRLMKEKKHPEDTEREGYDILERATGGIQNCCPGDDVWLGYETALSDIQSLLITKENI